MNAVDYLGEVVGLRRLEILSHTTNATKGRKASRNVISAICILVSATSQHELYRVFARISFPLNDNSQNDKELI